MAETTSFMLQVKSETEHSPYCTLHEAAFRAGLHPELLERFIRLGLIEFIDRKGDGEPLFDSSVVPLLRRILRLRNELGVNYAGIGLVLELMSRIEALEARVRELES